MKYYIIGNKKRRRARKLCVASLLALISFGSDNRRISGFAPSVLRPNSPFGRTSDMRQSLDTKTKGNEVILKISDFQLPPTAELAEIASKVKDSRELIDYWAIDWDYKGDAFHNQWQSFRTKKNPKVDHEATHKYEEPGEYQIMVKVVDVFGNDTNKVLKVRVK